MEKNILIYGAGLFGNLFAGRLEEGGHSVSQLDHGERLEELKALSRKRASGHAPPQRSRRLRPGYLNDTHGTKTK